MLTSVALLTLAALLGPAGASAQGIVVPKRSALIHGLNQQFRPKAANQTAGFPWRPALKSQVLRKQPPVQQALYLDRHQQEILAANPNLLNPSNLLTRSDANSANEQWQSLAANSSLNGSLAGRLDALTSGNQQQPQQQSSYRGFSLIELEVKSEADKRFVQELYGNLSAALNEQARELANSGPNGAPLTVSPYVDIDFWSFKFQAPNDQIDIMVSPKSRSFITGQLNRAKIRHRVKIDDIQARLDAQSAPPEQPSAAAGPTAPPKQLSGRNGAQIGASAADSLKARQAPVEPTGAPSAQTVSQRPMNDSQFFENYQRLADINQFLETLVERSPEIARVKVIGRSSQGRYLRVLRLGYGNQADAADLSLARRSLDEPPPEARAAGSPDQINNATYIMESFFRQQEAIPRLGSIWLDGGTHAREWISPSTVLYMAHRLADNHRLCSRFFGQLRQQVAAHEQELRERAERRAARRLRDQPLAGSLDEELVLGINEINTSLLGKPATPTRARTQAEHTLERLARSPQDLAAEKGCSLELDQLLRRYTFFMMPVLNPDGYEYSHTHNRLWRKTRSSSNHPIYRHFCLGADPNRNYDARHGQSGSSTHPCSQTYSGSVPFTEPETRHQSNFVYANRLDMKMYISFHSYSQMILLPFSHSKLAAPDHKDLDSVGQAAAKAIEQTHGTVYRVGPSASILYTASGTASDWAYEKAGVKYSYTIELRDTGAYGFLLPKQQILPTGEETFNGLLAMIRQMEKNDNLLITSKSSVLLAGPNQLALLGANLTTPADHLHAPDPDKLRPFARQRPRPPLENVLDGTDSWAATDLPPDGVRDRHPPIQLANDAEPLEHPDQLDLDPDAGYAFEGEGQLMEPSREQMLEAAKLGRIHELQQMSGRQDHLRRITQASGPSSSGRNFINSPLLSSRTSPSPIRRESSEDLPANGDY